MLFFPFGILLSTRRPRTAMPALIKAEVTTGQKQKKISMKKKSKLVQFFGKTHIVCEHKNTLIQKALLTNKL